MDKEKLSLLTELIKLARIDDRELEVEYEFMLSLADQLDVGKKEFDEIFSNYGEFVAPADEMERIIQLHRLILLMNVDGHVDERELDFIRNLGLKMGINPELIERVFMEMSLYKNGMIPSDRIIELYHQQLN